MVKLRLSSFVSARDFALGARPKTSGLASSFAKAPADGLISTCFATGEGALGTFWEINSFLSLRAKGEAIFSFGIALSSRKLSGLLAMTTLCSEGAFAG